MNLETYAALNILAERTLPDVEEGCREILCGGSLSVAGVVIRDPKATDDMSDGRNAVITITFQGSEEAMFVTCDQEIGVKLPGATWADRVQAFTDAMRADLKEGEVMP